MRNTDKRNVVIYDTTLRDGMQGMEISYSLQDKLQIAHKLDEMGVDYIEGGFPLSNDKEAAFFEQVRRERFGHAKIVAFGSTRKPGVSAARDPHIQALLQAETPAVIVVGKTWTEHVRHVLKTSLDENLEMIYDSLDTLRREGREVLFDLEHFFDGWRDDREYALKVLDAGRRAGAACLVLCDTNGGTLPSEVSRIVADLRERGFENLGVHFHNDLGCAVANSVMGIEAGANHVQGTINGWGERCGNANLCSVVPNIRFKMDLDCAMGPNLEHLTSLSRFVAEKANIIPDKRQPFVGEAAFSHKAGQHVDVLIKAPRLMEQMDAALVGNERRILLSELAGKSTVMKKLSRYGEFDKGHEVVRKLTLLLKEKEREGYEYEAAEASFDLLIRRTLDMYTPLISLKNYHLESFKSNGSPAKTVGRIFLDTAENQIMGAAVGIGPVETLDHAVRDALQHHYPFLKDIALIDYRVRVLNPEEAAAAKVRVFITTSDHKRSWDTVGVSENIVEASWEALVESLEYYYNNVVLPQ